ncbi:MAG: tripartite tricarboxylate transporter substrate binding protein [Betaproteobacteria bacterium]|nr:tripartite tricarboxylate transporter substrate binding protein [Betaproteobacteria bacterium]
MHLFTRCVIGALGALALAAGAAAQTYPAGPIRVIVPFPAGGGVDSMGRILGQKLTEALGKQIVIENRAGANGMIGSEIAAKSAKDGYTLLVNGANFVTTPSLYTKVTYDPIRDFDPVSLLSLAPNVLVAHPSLPAKSIKELIALARAKPGEVAYASSASGSTPHLAAELFKTMTGTDMLHVPYRGTGPAITALLSGEVGIMFMPTLAAVPHVQSGRITALAVTTRERLPVLPKLPTVAESGLKGYESSQWYGLLAPAGTPAEILDLLNSDTVKIMQHPEMKSRMTDSGSVAVGSTRDAFAAHLKDEFAKWAKVIKRSGAKVD